MKFDHHTTTKAAAQLDRIISAQQILLSKILRDVGFREALEIGPGAGGFSKYCRDRGIGYTGLEVNSRQAQWLRTRGYNVVCGDARTYNWQEARFDLVYMSHVAEHLNSYDDTTALVRCLSSLLTDRGHLVILCPDVRWSPRAFYIDPTHEYPTSLESLSRLATDLGAVVVRSGHYVGRWVAPWKLFWLAHRLMPLWVLPDSWAAKLDSLFAAHCYLILDRVPNV